MNRKFTDEQEYIIMGRLACGESTVTLAKEFGVARQTIASIPKRHSEFSAKLTLKKEELQTSILEEMEALKPKACEVFDLLLDAMTDEEKLARANISQIATAFGIIVDKFTKNEKPAPDSTAANNLLEALKGIAVKYDSFDELPPS